MYSIAHQGQTLFVVQLVCVYLVWSVTALRILARCRVGPNASAVYFKEDALMYFAVALYSILAGFALHGIVAGGTGKHADDMTLEETAVSFRAWFVCELLYGPLSAAVRTSIALFLLRLRPSGAEKRALYACLGIIYAFTIAYVLMNILQCSPPSYYWRQFEDFDAVGSCANPHLVPNAAIAHSAISALSDWFIALLTFQLLRKSMMKKWKKTVTIGFLTLGTIAGAVMVVRIPYIRVLEITPDFLYRTVDVAMWSIIEPCVGIVGGSLPFVKVLFGKKQLSRSVITDYSREKSGIKVSKTWEVLPTSSPVGPAFMTTVTAAPSCEGVKEDGSKAVYRNT